MDLKRYFDYFENLPNEIKSAEVYAQEADSFSVTILNGEIEDYNVSSTGGLSLRVDAGNVGYAYSECIEENPEKLAEIALNNALFVQSEDEELFNDSKEHKEFNYIQSVDQEDTTKKIEAAKQLENIALNIDARVKESKRCIIGSNSYNLQIVNSLGLNVKTSDAYTMAFCSVIAKEKDEIKDGSAFIIAKELKDIDLDALAKKAVDEAVSQLGAQQIETGKNDVIILNEAVCDLLAGFASVFSAYNVQKDLSLLKGKLNQVIASDIVNLYDNGMEEDSIIKTPFDAEGTLTKRTDIIVSGELKTYLHNLKTAKKDGVKTTGNAYKASAASPIGVSPNNMILQPGKVSFDELMKQLNNGVVITEVSGLHAGLNPVSGDFSLLCKGYQVVDKKRGKSVEQIMVVGNFLELLKNISQIANDSYNNIGFICPSILVKNMQIAGK